MGFSLTDCHIQIAAHEQILLKSKLHLSHAASPSSLTSSPVAVNLLQPCWEPYIASTVATACDLIILRTLFIQACLKS